MCTELEGSRYNSLWIIPSKLEFYFQNFTCHLKCIQLNSELGLCKNFFALVGESIVNVNLGSFYLF